MRAGIDVPAGKVYRIAPAPSLSVQPAIETAVEPEFVSSMYSAPPPSAPVGFTSTSLILTPGVGACATASPWMPRTAKDDRTTQDGWVFFTCKLRWKAPRCP